MKMLLASLFPRQKRLRELEDRRDYLSHLVEGLREDRRWLNKQMSDHAKRESSNSTIVLRDGLTVSSSVAIMLLLEHLGLEIDPWQGPVLKKKEK